jgi:predicted nucleotidyltransferase
MSPQLKIDKTQVADFCRRWRIREFSLFGSVLNEDFKLTSDVDVLVAFEEGAPWSLWDLVMMRDELRQMFGREVDLVEKRALVNPFRKRHILDHREVIHSA